MRDWLCQCGSRVALSVKKAQATSVALETVARVYDPGHRYAGLEEASYSVILSEVKRSEESAWTRRDSSVAEPASE